MHPAYQAYMEGALYLMIRVQALFVCVWLAFESNPSPYCHVIPKEANGSFHSVTGRRLVGQLMNGLREVVVDCYAVVPRQGSAAANADSGKNAGALLEAAREIRRLCNLLFAFVRQDVRESKCGFIPGSDLEGMTYDPATNFYMDPCRPRIWDLLSEEETVRYVGMMCACRQGPRLRLLLSPNQSCSCLLSPRMRCLSFRTYRLSPFLSFIHRTATPRFLPACAPAPSCWTSWRYVHQRAVWIVRINERRSIW
jgi:hypothetical protein